MKLEDRMNKLEVAVTAHLEESGAIRADLAWVKKGVLTLAGAVVTFTVTLLVGMLLFLLKR